MIRLGLRLAVAGGREALTRLALIGAAVAIGVALLLSTVAAINAVQSQNDRYGWLNSAAAGPAAAGPIWWATRTDRVQGREAVRVDVAATGPDVTALPDGSPLPAPGEYRASPALAALIGTVPSDQLAARYPGRRAGTLSGAALPSPDSLIVVVGRTTEQVRALGGVRIARLATGTCADCSIGTSPDGLLVILGVVTAALLFPLLMFIGTATRLSATRREQRFAAMRLLGATPRQITRLAVVESTASAAAGVLAGFVVFLAVRPLLDRVTWTGERFFRADLWLPGWQFAAVAAGVLLGAAVAARLALRRVRISPLGVTRRTRPQPPRAWRLLPVGAGLAILSVNVVVHVDPARLRVLLYLTGILLVMAGLVIAGLWLTMTGARLLAHRAHRPAAMIAGRRLADDPRAGFRAVSGLMVALFVTTVATGIIATITARDAARPAGDREHSMLAVSLDPDYLDPGQRPLTERSVAAVRAVPGVTAVLVVRDRGSAEDGLPGVAGCADLARSPQFGTCPPWAETARVWHDLSNRTDAPRPAWEAAPVRTADLARLPVSGLVIATDGTDAAIERARTAFQRADPEAAELPVSQAERDSASTRTAAQYQRLAYLVIVASLLIAGCSLAVGTAGGLLDRRRPFALLRLGGVRLNELRRVVAWESAVPLMASSLLAITAGFAAAHLFLRAQLAVSLQPPPGSYYLLVTAGLVGSLGLIASTMPLLRRITGPETARSE